MTDTTLQAQSKKQRLAELGRAIFNRQSGSNTISARSQRLFRATKAKSIWKNGLGKARKHWSKVRKHKRSTRRESTFDSIYPVGPISWPIPQGEQDFFSFPSQIDNNRDSAAISVTVTTPTPSNSQRDQGKRQTVWIVRNGDVEPSPLRTGPLRPRPGSVSIAHPQVAVVGETPSTPTTTRSSNTSDPTSNAGSEDWSSKPEPCSKWSLSDVSSGKLSPETETFPGQVNPTEIAEKRKSQDARRLSHDILDGHRRSDRDLLPSQLGKGSDEPDVPSKRASMPTKTPSVLKPGKTRNRPTTMHFGAVLSPVQESAFSSPDRDNFKPGPEIPPIALPGTTMEGVRDSMFDIAGHPRETTPSGGPDEALNALEGKRSSKNATRRSTVRFGGSELSPVIETAFSSPDRTGFDEVPELPPIALPGTTMEGVRDSLIVISGDAEQTTQPIAHSEALNALEGKTPVDRDPSQITDWEVDSAMNADHAKYPGKQPYRQSTYEPFQKGKIQKPQPVPIIPIGHSTPSTPITPPRSSRGKQPADAKIQENLAKARDEVNRKHRTLSRMFDQGYLVTPPASVSGRESSAAEGSEHPSGVGCTFLDPETPPLRQETPTPAPRPPPRIARKPVARQPSQKNPNTDKPLPNPPAQKPSNSPPSRLTLLETRITALETQLSTRPRPAAAAAAASAAASLHSAIHASSNVPRGPHRARASRKRDVHHEPRQPAREQPSLGSVFRDVVVLGKSTWGRF
ncbi:hypothetical protein PRZ48_001239 [Zasmidium cellare]|uniref:Uncharacterized protein n=1 Tax=Zasmidium cellare TaxID=395010 RepID=A0ABR0F0P6_ZASCE|nr:hypothetical protein PRZ48_001239 [Zasmidium cellare]